MIQQCFDFKKDHNGDLKKPALKMGTPPEIILQFYGKSFLTGWMKVKRSVRF